MFPSHILFSSSHLLYHGFRANRVQNLSFGCLYHDWIRSDLHFGDLICILGNLYSGDPICISVPAASVCIFILT